MVPSGIEFVLVGTSEHLGVSSLDLLVHILILSSSSPQSGMDGKSRMQFFD